MNSVRPSVRPVSRDSRRGAAAVEFALLAPVFVTLVLGSIEIGRGCAATQKLASALREGGRLATMDYSDHLQKGQTPNDKVIQDIRNFLTASGIPGSKVTLSITHADGQNAGQTFNFADPGNALSRFQIRAEIPYSALGTTYFIPTHPETLHATLVWRMGRSSLVD